MLQYGYRNISNDDKKRKRRIEMSKKILGGFLVSAILFGFGVAVRADDANANKTESSVAVTEQVDKNKNESENQSEPTKQVDPVKEVTAEVEAEKAKMREGINVYNVGELKNQAEQLLAKVEQATTMEELQGIYAEINKLGASYAASIARNNGINIVKDLQRLNKLTKAEADAYIERLEKAKTTDEIDVITQEFSKLINVDAYLKKKDELTKYIQSLMEQGKLTKEQTDKLLGQIENSRYLEELVNVELEVAKELEKNEGLTKEAFEESQKNLIIQIKKLVDEGKLTKEQGDTLIAKAEKSKTINDLTAIWEEAEKLVKDNQNGKKTTKEPATGLQKILPQTGEKQTMINVFLGIIILVGGGFAFWKVKTTKSSEE